MNQYFVGRIAAGWKLSWITQWYLRQEGADALLMFWQAGNEKLCLLREGAEEECAGIAETAEFFVV